MHFTFNNDKGINLDRVVCSTATGKCGEGYDVSHKRNVSAGGSSSVTNSSQMRSSVVIHETARWQF